uniref:Uncharacterized protein n=1 Tax=Globodera rostochiensis TaxID=31243 RepID=A0A914GNP8_GLORO
MSYFLPAFPTHLHRRFARPRSECTRWVLSICITRQKFHFASTSNDQSKLCSPVKEICNIRVAQEFKRRHSQRDACPDYESFRAWLEHSLCFRGPTCYRFTDEQVSDYVELSEL